jgi:FkbM family methyltransferase
MQYTTLLSKRVSYLKSLLFCKRQSPASDVIEVNAIFGKIFAFANDVITNQIVSFGAHTRPEVAFLMSVVQSGDAVFDIGGHIGTFAIPLAQKIGTAGRLLAVEGDPRNFELLCRNIDRLHLGNIAFPCHSVIGPTKKRYLVQNPGLNTGASYFLPTDGPGGIPAISLDDLVVAHYAPRVVKIDIEGLEVAAFRDSPMLLTLRPILYVEVAVEQLKRYGASVEELDKILQKHGYRLFRNVGARNGAHDEFFVQELSSLSEGGNFFDVLALHREDSRLRYLLL